MNIGIITFHWATNYGAVLQAYALQEYLSMRGHNVKIIDYCPNVIKIKQSIDAIRKLNFVWFIQEKRLKRFRNTYLQLSDKHYSSHRQLINGSMNLDYIIAGSDQIWNESFTLRGEGKVTLSYFLDFAKDSTKRIAYAVSFGFHTPSKSYNDAVADQIKKFSAISVRETDGIDIVNTFGVRSCVVCDPTVLLTKKDYIEIAKRAKYDGKEVFAYILRDNQKDAWRIASFVGGKYGLNITENKFAGSMEEWLASIFYSRIVVTNSFHGIMLSILMNKPFIALTINGSGMNSRITTILNQIGLSSRMIECYSEREVERIMSETINWEMVDIKMNELRIRGENFLKGEIK